LASFLVLSAFASVDTERSMNVLFDYWIKTFVFVWLVLLWTQTEADLRRIFTVLVACFSLLALRAIYRYAVGYPEIAGLAGTMGDRNDFALHLAMVAPIAYFMAQITKTFAYKWFFALSAVLIITTVALTFSRMGFLLILVAAAMLWWSSGHKVRNLIVFASIAGLLVAILPDTYFDRMSTIRDYEGDASAMGRIIAWDAGLKMGIENPLTGVGLKCFELPHIYHKYAASGPPHVAHNAYVQLFSEAGAFSLLFWLLLALNAAIVARRLAARAPSIETRSYARAMLHSIVLYLIGCMFLNAAYFELPYIIFACILALKNLPQHPMAAALAR
jgi:probable O-glycosylation ligase (exosortase A-associated)